MTLLKHIALSLALHATLLAVAGDRDPVPGTLLDATPFREASTTAQTRLLRHGSDLQLEFRLPAAGEGTVTLLNAAGGIVLRERVSGQGKQVRNVKNSAVVNGPYTVRIEQDGFTLSRKLVIEQA